MVMIKFVSSSYKLGGGGGGDVAYSLTLLFYCIFNKKHYSSDGRSQIKGSPRLL